MVRNYGGTPVRAAVVHGGPGALGSVACVARELSRTCGVIEPMQSKYTIAALIDELAAQLRDYTQEAVTLIGHSWGAWLIVLFAQAYPEMARQLILVGSGPFRASYVPQIARRRLQNLSEEEGRAFHRAVAQLNDDACPDRDRALETLGALADKADNYAPLDTSAPGDCFPADGAMYASVWREADALRADGTLCAALAGLRCPVTVIHGAQDPHPAEGVTEPLREQGVAFSSYILPKCGHSPFQETYAMERFYEILRGAVRNVAPDCK